MQIRAFDIYDFGILSKQSLSELPSGLLIFLGENEAGKSTSLEFFRTLLTGFQIAAARKRKKEFFQKRTHVWEVCLNLKHARVIF